MRRLVILLLAVAGAVGLAAGASIQVSGAAAVPLPVVHGGFGSTPTISFPAGSPPKGLQVQVLHRGSGATVAKGELLVANYVGQIWQGKVFDSSFSRNQVAAFPIGVGDVIKGWDESIVGKPIGSRLLLVVPPLLGYGTSGNSQAGITGTDTLVFVVDLVAAYSKKVGSTENATLLKTSSGGVSVTHPLSTDPTLAISNAANKPKTESAVVLARGNGAKVVPGMIILQFVVYNWSNQVVASTWKTAVPDGEYVGDTSQPSSFDVLVGDHIGSRVLMEIPQNSNGGPYALEVLIAGEVSSGASR